MRVICLGSGTSTGVPMIACTCAVCVSDDPRNHRLRCSVLIELPEGALLIDTPPELRLACLANDVRDISAVCLTHTHADHLMGMDDIRQINFRKKGDMPIYGEPQFLEDVRRVFQYVFMETGHKGGGKPRLHLLPLEPGREFPLLGARILPLRVFHGAMPVTAYRIGGFAYVTDVSSIPPETMEALRDLDVLILGAIREQPHSTHFCIEEGIAVAQDLKPRRTFFTHLTHDVDYTELASRLPPGILPAHDGLILDAAD